MPRFISDAHEWAHRHGLIDNRGRFDNSNRQFDGTYVPTLASDDLLAEPCEFFVVGTEDGATPGRSLGFCSAMRFPDGSALWWTEDHWSVSDGEGIDITREWQLEEVTTTHRK